MRDHISFRGGDTNAKGSGNDCVAMMQMRRKMRPDRATT
ncbi:Hypothetical protein A7982_08079 [Minicystis rosea]|nr:Hypothetical protein A7982_08079 [Minicystis rosea]